MEMIDATTGRPFDVIEFMASSFVWDAKGDGWRWPQAASEGPGFIHRTEMLASADDGAAIARRVLARDGWRKIAGVWLSPCEWCKRSMGDCLDIACPDRREWRQGHGHGQPRATWPQGTGANE